MVGVGSLAAMLILLQPVKDFFYTREEGNALEKRVEKLEENYSELVLKIDNSSQQIRTDISARIDSMERNLNNRFNLLTQAQLMGRERNQDKE